MVRKSRYWKKAIKKLSASFSRLIGLVFIGVLASTSFSRADEVYPSRRVTVLVAYPAGGPVDALARLLAHAMQRKFNQPFVVENRPGAGGVIGHGANAKAAPDGYTLLFAADPVQTMVPHIQNVTLFDPLKDYSPIGILVNSVFAFVVNPNYKVNSLSELINDLKARPSEVKYGSAGIGSGNQFATELFSQRIGVKLRHVPYNGGAPAITDLMGGQVDLMIISVSSVADLVDAGKLKALAVADRKRSIRLPNVPTTNEAGLPGFTANAWFGLEGPPNLPAPIVQKLNQAMQEATNDPEFKNATDKLGYSVEVSSPNEMKARIDASFKQWQEVAAASNIAGTK